MSGRRSSLITAPVADIITLAEAKAAARVDTSDDDTYIGTLIEAATAHLDGADGVLGRALITQTWRLSLDDIPTTDVLYLPVPRVQSISSITYHDVDGAEQTLASSNYRFVSEGDMALVELVSGASWPGLDARRSALRVDYVTGYGDAATAVPASIRHAAKMLIAHWYEAREAVIIGTISSQLPLGTESLLMPHRVRLG